MTTLVAGAEPLRLRDRDLPGPQLDPSSLLTYTAAEPLSLNGTVRSNVIADPDAPIDLGWLEPPPGTEPAARTVALMRVRTDEGAAAGIVAPVELFQLPQGQLIRAVHYTLTLAIGTTADWHILRWWLEPGGDDATLRADGLAFLEALHRPGELAIADIEGQHIAALRLAEAQEFDPEIRQAHQFLAETAALEEWSGRKIPLPLEVPAADVEEVVRAAAMVRARVVPLTVGDELDLTVRATETDPVEVDTLILPREIWAQPLGIEVPLGNAEVVVAVEVVDSEELPEGLVRVRCRLSQDQPRSVMAHLYPPATRSRQVRRTLVGGAPLPPDGLLSERVATDLRLQALTSFLERELADGELPPDLLAEVEAKWPE